MTKNTLIIAISVVLFISIGAAVGVYSFTKASYQKQMEDIDDKKNEYQTNINRIKEDKDLNGHLPSDIVKLFMGEVKFDSNEKAKLYLSKDKKNLNYKQLLNIDQPLSEIITKEVEYKFADENEEQVEAKYSFTFTNSDDIPSVKYFDLSMEDGAWKIINIREF